MPSKKANAATHIAFIPLLVLVFIVWGLYRFLFRFPVWFDETIGKAVFFGLPVWLYLSMTRSKAIKETFSLQRIQVGLSLGVLFGGIFGFVGVLASLVANKAAIQPAPLFLSSGFWWQFFLALMTGFWESLFFYSWIMVVLQEKTAKWSLFAQVMAVSVIFLAFHLPNLFLRFPLWLVMGQASLLLIFAVGQGLLFARTRNVYALMVSQAIWGMVLMVHTAK